MNNIKDLELTGILQSSRASEIESKDGMSSTGPKKVDWLQERYDKLTGKYKHWCYDWDDLPIDETTSEWSGCNCGYKEWKDKQ